MWLLASRIWVEMIYDVSSIDSWKLPIKDSPVFSFFSSFLVRHRGWSGEPKSGCCHRMETPWVPLLWNSTWLDTCESLWPWMLLHLLFVHCFLTSLSNSKLMVYLRLWHLLVPSAGTLFLVLFFCTLQILWVFLFLCLFYKLKVCGNPALSDDSTFW